MIFQGCAIDRFLDCVRRIILLPGCLLYVRRTTYLRTAACPLLRPGRAQVYGNMRRARCFTQELVCEVTWLGVVPDCHDDCGVPYLELWRSP